MGIKILEGKREKIPVEVSLNVSPKVDIISIVKKRIIESYNITPIENPLWTEECNAEETYLRNIWNGNLFPSYNSPLPTVHFSYMGYNGEMNWVILQLLLNKIINVSEAKKLDTYFWKIKGRIKNYWNTSDWKDIRGLKIVGEKL